MKRLFRVVLVLVLIGLGIWLWRYFNPAPEEAIRRHLHKLAEVGSFEPGEGLVAREVAAQKIGAFFGPEIFFNVEPRDLFPESMTREDLVSNVGILRSSQYIRSLRLKVLDPIITLGADAKSAIVELTLHAESPGERHLLVQEMKFTMKQVEDDWLIVRVETVRTLNQQTAPTRWHLAFAL
jgi:hypothetical protein